MMFASTTRLIAGCVRFFTFKLSCCQISFGRLISITALLSELILRHIDAAPALLLQFVQLAKINKTLLKL